MIQALPLQVSSGLERGMVRSSRANLILRNRLSGRPPRLDELFGDPSLPRLTLHPGGRTVEFRWRLRMDGPSGSLLQLALTDAFFESLRWPRGARRSLMQALALCETAAFMPALRSFFEQDVDVCIEETPQGWPETDHWSKFQLYLPALGQQLPGRIIDPFALKLARLLGHPGPNRGGDVPLTLLVGTQLQVPVSAALRLSEGDVLLCDAALPAHTARLYVASVSARGEGRYLATVRRDDGRVEHLAAAPGTQRDASADSRGSCVSLDVVEGRMTASSERCCGFAIGDRLEEWRDIEWLDAPEVLLGGRRLAWAHRTSIAGRIGFEIRALQPR